MPRALVAILVALPALGCAREPLPARAPGYAPNTAYAWPMAPPTGLVAPPAPPLLAGVGVSAESPSDAPTLAPGAPASSPRPDVPLISSHEIPGGERCLRELADAGVAFSRIEEKRGIDTPIEVTSAIGGIRYEAGAGHSMVCDCRFALALARVAPVLHEAGLTAARFSGAYSYRMSRVGRLSLHAYGLALDLHEFVIEGRRLSVTSDFVRGLDWCSAEAPPLNHLACELKATGLFRELLTPDYNADHHDHFHWGLAPLDRPMPQAPAKPAPSKAASAKAAGARVPPLPEPVEIDQEPTVEPEPVEAPKSKPATTPTHKPKHKQAAPNERSSAPPRTSHQKTAARQAPPIRRRHSRHSPRGG